MKLSHGGEKAGHKERNLKDLNCPQRQVAFIVFPAYKNQKKLKSSNVITFTIYRIFLFTILIFLIQGFLKICILFLIKSTLNQEFPTLFKAVYSITWGTCQVQIPGQSISPNKPLPAGPRIYTANKLHG